MLAILPVFATPQVFQTLPEQIATFLLLLLHPVQKEVLMVAVVNALQAKSQL